jgi:hypothetical protein
MLGNPGASFAGRGAARRERNDASLRVGWANAEKRRAHAMAEHVVADPGPSRIVKTCVIVGQKARSAVLTSNDPAIHAIVTSAWTTGSSPVVTSG